jgi:hypothetical protein
VDHAVLYVAVTPDEPAVPVRLATPEEAAASYSCGPEGWIETLLSYFVVVGDHGQIWIGDRWERPQAPGRGGHSTRAAAIEAARRIPYCEPWRVARVSVPLIEWTGDVRVEIGGDE